MKNTKEKQQLFHMYIQLSCRSHALCNLHIYHNRSVRRNTSTTSQCPPQPIPVHEKKRKKTGFHDLSTPLTHGLR